MTLEELKQNILIRLGSPVINIEIATEQMEVQIKDATDKFIEVHYDGLDEGYIFLDQIIDQKEYALPNEIYSVLDIIGGTGSVYDTGGEALLVNPFLVGNNYASLNSGVLDLVMFQQTAAQYNSLMEEKILFDFNTTTQILTIHETPIITDRLALRVHSSPASLLLVYENIWVKQYSTALCKITWAGNLGKFRGGMLPSGAELNFDMILAEGKEEKEKLELELYEKYQEPVDFFHG